MRIVITGGHHTSALVVAKALGEKGHKVFWVGHRYSMWQDRKPSAEYKEVIKAGFSFFDLKAGKFYRTFNPLKLARLPLGFLRALFYVATVKPCLIVSFGGYLAVPVVLGGRLFKIPCITHEQTVVSGLANKLIAFFAQKILLTWPMSLKYFPKEKTAVVGLPLRKEIFTKGKFSFKNDLPVIYITGGKQGAHVINRAVLGCLEKLLPFVNVIHQCGSTTLYEDEKVAKEKRQKLSLLLRERYIVKEYFFASEIGEVLNGADLVVSRAGAHIIYELAALGKPALLIPIPWAYGNEQIQNAKILEQIGLAEILPQKNLTDETLMSKVTEMLGNIAKYEKNARKASKLVILNGTERVVEEIEKMPRGSPKP